MKTENLTHTNTIHIRYTIDDQGKITTIDLPLEQIEEGELYAILHNSERYTLSAKVIKRELIDDEQ
jgi:hypothetical protein